VFFAGRKLVKAAWQLPIQPVAQEPRCFLSRS